MVSNITPYEAVSQSLAACQVSKLFIEFLMQVLISYPNRNDLH